jgi:hypothetical protein
MTISKVPDHPNRDYILNSEVSDVFNMMSMYVGESGLQAIFNTKLSKGLYGEAI